LWGSLKYKVYKTNPQSVEELRNKICLDISAVSVEELERVNTNMLHRYTEYIWSGGQQLQYLL
jgi:hypothetical protein